MLMTTPALVCFLFFLFFLLFFIPTRASKVDQRSRLISKEKVDVRNQD